MRWRYSVQCIYGRHAEPPRRTGDLAIATDHGNTHSRDMEIAAGRNRKDIGRVLVRELPNGPWETAYDEENP